MTYPDGEETGLHYNYFRDYEPGTGRYSESDPLGIDGGISTYAYAAGRPSVATDSEGLSVFWDAWNHYCDGTGTPWTVSFASVDWGSAVDNAKRMVAQMALGQGCKKARIYIAKAFGASAIGDYANVIGRHVLRFSGDLNASCDCSWAFSGSIESATGADPYDFDPLNRGAWGEFKTWVGRMRCPRSGVPFKIYLPGQVQMAASGKNHGSPGGPCCR